MFHLRSDHNRCTAIRHNMLLISGVQLRLQRKRTHNQNAEQTSHLFDLLYHTWCFMGLLHMCIHRLKYVSNATGNAICWSWSLVWCVSWSNCRYSLLSFSAPCSPYEILIHIEIWHTFYVPNGYCAPRYPRYESWSLISHIGVYLFISHSR